MILYEFLLKLVIILADNFLFMAQFYQQVFRVSRRRSALSRLHAFLLLIHKWFLLAVLLPSSLSPLLLNGDNFFALISFFSSASFLFKASFWLMMFSLNVLKRFLLSIWLLLLSSSFQFMLFAVVQISEHYVGAAQILNAWLNQHTAPKVNMKFFGRRLA